MSILEDLGSMIKILAPEYRQAVLITLLQQIPVGLFSALLLDSGRAARFVGISIACFWCSALFIFIRRPLNPTACDLVFLKAAFFPILFGVFIFTAIIRGIYYSGNE